MHTLEQTVLDHPFLRGLKPEHLEMLQAAALPVQFEPGQRIIREGDVANRFYLILEGEVALEAFTEESGPFFIQKLGPGDVLGWSWLIAPHYWHFDARVIQPVRGVYFYAARLRQCCEEDHELGFELIKRVSQVLNGRLESILRQWLGRA